MSICDKHFAVFLTQIPDFCVQSAATIKKGSIKKIEIGFNL